MDEAIKNLNIGAKVLPRRSRGMLDNLLASDYTEKLLAVSIMTTNSLRHQTDFLGTKKTKLILDGVPLYISLDYLSFSFQTLERLTVTRPSKVKPG